LRQINDEGRARAHAGAVIAEEAMTYKTLMVHVDLEDPHDAMLKIAGDLAELFGAHVIGIAACQPLQTMVGEGVTAGELMVEDRAEITREIAAAEDRFRKAMEGRAASVEWRHFVTYAPLASYIADEARAADLIISGPDMGMSLLDNTRRVKLGDLALEAGRPLLIIPHNLKSLGFRRVVVGWKEAREPRRAIADALPFLARAEHVTVLQAAHKELLEHARANLRDVIRWLGRHGVEAVPAVAVGSDNDFMTLYGELKERNCDLFVAGAYGHSRLGEFVFGGVTRDLLLDADFPVLISH
jgi:nucleotide-binding universal stress UspA family protein